MTDNVDLKCCPYMIKLRCTLDLSYSYTGHIATYVYIWKSNKNHVKKNVIVNKGKT